MLVIKLILTALLLGVPWIICALYPGINGD